jgi:hypothetical protein
MRLPGASYVTSATRRIQPRKIQICPAYGRPVLKQALRRAKAVRARLSATVAAFAVSEDNAALIFDQLAASHPERAGAYQRKAQQARDAADRAREISGELAD